MARMDADFDRRNCNQTLVFAPPGASQGHGPLFPWMETGPAGAQSGH